jgi:hypothetical protein
VSLAPLQLSVPASDGPILKGALTYPPRVTGRSDPLAIFARQYPATRDSLAPLIDDLLEWAASTETWSGGLAPARAPVVAGSGHAMAIALGR